MIVPPAGFHISDAGVWSYVRAIIGQGVQI